MSDAQLQLSQAAAPCMFTLDRRSATIGAGGGELTVTVGTLTGCSWTASSAVGWMTIASGHSGSASAPIGITVAANSGASRTGDVVIGGATFRVTQDAVAPNPPGPSPPPPAPPPPSSQIGFDGRIWFVLGRCPDVTLRIDGDTIATSRSTEYRDGSCGDLSSGDHIKGRGVRRADGVIEAARIELKKDDDDD